MVLLRKLLLGAIIASIKIIKRVKHLQKELVILKGFKEPRVQGFE
jgi:hypothetical protein